MKNIIKIVLILALIAGCGDNRGGSDSSDILSPTYDATGYWGVGFDNYKRISGDCFYYNEYEGTVIDYYQINQHDNDVDMVDDEVTATYNGTVSGTNYNLSLTISNAIDEYGDAYSGQATWAFTLTSASDFNGKVTMDKTFLDSGNKCIYEVNVSGAKQ